MFAVGEFWKDSVDSLEGYLGSLETQFSVFDAPLHYNFKEAGDQAENYDIRKIWDDTVVASRPIDAVTLVDNHECVIQIYLEVYVTDWDPAARRLDKPLRAGSRLPSSLWHTP